MHCFGRTSVASLKQHNEFSTAVKDHLPNQLFRSTAHWDQVMAWPSVVAWTAAVTESAFWRTALDWRSHINYVNGNYKTCLCTRTWLPVSIWAAGVLWVRWEELASPHENGSGCVVDVCTRGLRERLIRVVASQEHSSYVSCCTTVVAWLSEQGSCTNRKVHSAEANAFLFKYMRLQPKSRQMATYLWFDWPTTYFRVKQIQDRLKSHDAIKPNCPCLNFLLHFSEFLYR